MTLPLTTTRVGIRRQLTGRRIAALCAGLLAVAALAGVGVSQVVSHTTRTSYPASAARTTGTDQSPVSVSTVAQPVAAAEFAAAPSVASQAEGPGPHFIAGPSDDPTEAVDSAGAGPAGVGPVIYLVGSEEQAAFIQSAVPAFGGVLPSSSRFAVVTSPEAASEVVREVASENNFIRSAATSPLEVTDLRVP
jgi:hypothetical protein